MWFAWNRTAEAESEPEQAPADPTPFDLAAVEVLSESGRFIGWISTDGERTSDWLNHQEQVPIYGLTERLAIDGSQELPDVAIDRVEHLRRDEITWIVPPPLPPNRHLRLHRRRVRVWLEFDEHNISGQVHVRPGADASDYLLRGSRQLVPLTDVEIASRHDPADRGMLPVVIVNVQHVRHMQSEGNRRYAPRGIEPVAPATPTPVATAPAPSAATATRPASASRDRTFVALVTLLEAGVIDMLEFQALRAKAASRAEAGARH